MEFSDLIHERYSVRAFSDKPVESEKLHALLEAARVAPTAVNRQPFTLYLATSETAQEYIRAATPYHFGAKTFIIVAAHAKDGWHRKSDNKPFADIDASIAATHIMLAACDQGLGTTWVGSFDSELLKQLEPQLSDVEVVAIFPIGYPAEDAQPSPRHEIRKPLEELVVEL